MIKKSVPEDASLVYQGEIFKIYQWKQRLYDGSTATFEKVIRPNTVEVIAVDGDKIIFTEQEQPHRDPFLALPGGRVVSLILVKKFVQHAFILMNYCSFLKTNSFVVKADSRRNSTSYVFIRRLKRNLKNFSFHKLRVIL